MKIKNGDWVEFLDPDTYEKQPAQIIQTKFNCMYEYDEPYVNVFDEPHYLAVKPNGELIVLFSIGTPYLRVCASK